MDNPAVESTGAVVPAVPRPQEPGQRIQVIDVLRGAALLGILIINMMSFATPFAVYFNPTAWGSFVGVERLLWILSHVLADQKFMTIFSPLFGAGILLFTTRLETRGQPARALFFRRSLWLLLFGLLHLFLLWDGDILVVYALTGMVLYGLRLRAPTTLVVLGLLFLCVHMVLMLFLGWLLPQAPAEVLNKVAAGFFQPGPADLAADIAIFQGPYGDQLQYRWQESGTTLLFNLVVWGTWRAGGLMLIGMAAWKWGVLTAERSTRFYQWLMIIGLGLGWPVVVAGLWDKMHHGWDFLHAVLGGGYLYNYWGSLLVSAGYVGLVMWVERRGRWPAARQRLAAVGRMAFTNYILHTLICTFVFYGFGLGLYAQVNRVGQAGIILAIWIFQLWFSPWWLSRFRYGPLEWLWRSLTYGRRAPMRIMGAGTGVADSPSRPG